MTPEQKRQEAEERRRKYEDGKIKNRWVDTVCAVVGLMALHNLARKYVSHSVSLEDWIGVFGFSVWFLVITCSALQSWRLWWRRKHPEGARLAFRFWEKTGKAAVSLPAPEEDEHIWPPAPKRPD